MQAGPGNCLANTGHQYHTTRVKRVGERDIAADCFAICRLSFALLGLLSHERAQFFFARHRNLFEAIKNDIGDIFAVD